MNHGESMGTISPVIMNLKGREKTKKKKKSRQKKKNTPGQLIA
jgi:hypothetical protein